jgi:hypothetical protein
VIAEQGGTGAGPELVRDILVCGPFQLNRDIISLRGLGITDSHRVPAETGFTPVVHRKGGTELAVHLFIFLPLGFEQVEQLLEIIHRAKVQRGGRSGRKRAFQVYNSARGMRYNSNRIFIFMHS